MPNPTHSPSDPQIAGPPQIRRRTLGATLVTGVVAAIVPGVPATADDLVMECAADIIAGA